LALAPKEGWLEPWWPAVMVGFILVNCLICGLLFTTLLSK
jgi:hypothetical protein